MILEININNVNCILWNKYKVCTQKIYRNLAPIDTINRNYTIRWLVALGETWIPSRKLCKKQEKWEVRASSYREKLFKQK